MRNWTLWGVYEHAPEDVVYINAYKSRSYANKRAKEFERFPAVKIIVKEADGVKPKPEDFRKEKL